MKKIFKTAIISSCFFLGLTIIIAYFISDNFFDQISQAIDDISAFKNLWVEKNYRIQQLSEQVIQLQEERQSLERTINEKNNEINKLKEQIEKYRYSRDDKQTLYR